jgi:hypothetical protein
MVKTLIIEINPMTLILKTQKFVGTIGSICQRQGNWDHVEVLAFIKCRKQEHVNFKPLVDPRSQMLSTTHK